MRNAVDIVDEFQRVVAEYTGAPYAVAVESCTSALFLCCTYLGVEEVTIPARTYVSVPNAIIHSGGSVKFRDYEWQGIYQLEPYPVYDAAKRFTSGMYIPGSYMCLSFHGKKILRIIFLQPLLKFLPQNVLIRSSLGNSKLLLQKCFPCSICLPVFPAFCLE